MAVSVFSKRVVVQEKFCAKNKIYPQIQVIKAEEINDAWDKVVNKEARYRYVIDVSGSASVNIEEASTTYFSPRVINEAL